jgi:hypothetical protein
MGPWSGAKLWLRVGSSRQTVGYAGRIACGWPQVAGVDGLKGLIGEALGLEGESQRIGAFALGSRFGLLGSYGAEGRVWVT